MGSKLEKAPGALNISGKWPLLSRLLMFKLAQLTNSELCFEFGKNDKPVLRLVERLNKTRELTILLKNDRFKNMRNTWIQS